MKTTSYQIHNFLEYLFRTTVSAIDATVTSPNTGRETNPYPIQETTIGPPYISSVGEKMPKRVPKASLNGRRMPKARDG